MAREARDKSRQRQNSERTLGANALSGLIQAVARHLDPVVLQEMMRGVGAQLGRQALLEYCQTRHVRGRPNSYTWAECLKKLGDQFGWTLRVAVESEGVIRVTVLGCRLAESSESESYLCEFGSGLFGGAMAEAIGDVKVCMSECSGTPSLNCAYVIYYRTSPESLATPGIVYSQIGDRVAQRAQGQPDCVQGTRLTARETQVLQHIAQGLPDKKIAAALQLSVRTVENHAARIRKKLDIGGGRTALVRFAFQNRLIDLFFTYFPVIPLISTLAIPLS
ncbi:LuxR C-terminal-related transcriptional regulator [Candidatus Methylomirabilis sp.]|uniref:response regulator transcription factor n=1 Tax=Candidatus Methylomirabilis sp. TaxID=2032687 RepID=UPI002A5DF181|nr:LuxR C-terminal-related transcriptional regulator [Candidatus Methylomirabilis sp.]